MRADTGFSRLIRVIVVIIFLYSLYLFLSPLVGFVETPMKVKFGCEPVNRTEDYCYFKCKLTPNMDATAIIKVTHTIWASIYEKKFELEANKTKEIYIQLPRRRFIYWLRAIFFKQVGERKGLFLRGYDVYYDLNQTFLAC